MSESKLYFPLGDPEGFTSKKLADKPAGYPTPIRELLQNSFDACRKVEKKCDIRITLVDLPKSDIPHIKDYEQTLEMAIETQKSGNTHNDNAKRVVKRIKDALKAKSLPMLMFSDNGTGMNPSQIDAILSGQSMHDDEAAAGSYGVGNLTSYALSSLQYVLYTSKYRDDGGAIKNLFTGSPILAGHITSNAQRSNRGRIVIKDTPRREERPEYRYLDVFPPALQPQMDMVDTGTIVTILGLNKLWNQDAEYAIVSNFFHAIANNTMTVRVNNFGRVTNIDAQFANRLIEQFKDGKNAMGDAILSGRAVHQVWSAFRGDDHQIDINIGNADLVKVHVCTDPQAYDSTIVLVRNGMLIARHDSMFSDDIKNLRKSGDFEKFTAVIDVDQKSAPTFFKLVKGSEGPYHNRLENNRLIEGGEQQRLKDLFKELTDGIQKYLEPLDRAKFELPLFGIPDDQATAQAPGKPTKTGQAPKAKPVKSTALAATQSKPSDLPKDTKRPKPNIITRQLSARHALRYKDAGNTWQIHMQVTPSQRPKDDDYVYLSVCLAEDSDGDNSIKRALQFESIQINNKPIVISVSAHNHGDASTVCLGVLPQGESHTIVAHVQKPKDIQGIQVALQPIFGLKKRE